VIQHSLIQVIWALGSYQKNVWAESYNPMVM